MWIKVQYYPVGAFHRFYTNSIQVEDIYTRRELHVEYWMNWRIFFLNRLCGNFFVKSYNCVCFGKNKVIQIFLFIEYCIIREDREERDSPKVILLQFRWPISYLPPGTEIHLLSTLLISFVNEWIFFYPLLDKCFDKPFNGVWIRAWNPIHWIWIRIQNFGPIWIQIRAKLSILKQK